ncbi:DUF6198 family protein [Corynebacterium breve]|uniref:DUF6198 family protein n=1 Tax=Corynebacterium breve TaxID=3049799 RepID=A0ABY8VGU5_9CORY|nr:DUF6198 family protein [Corynebacterium breve]WIM68874.1 DUF6198 family protein [Corynebacterium breve]
MERRVHGNRGAGLAVRFLISIVGVSFVMLGVAFITLAGLGTSPVSAPVWVATLAGGLSFGGWTAVWNMILIGVQLLLLRREFPLHAWWQIPAIFVASVTLDLWMALFSGFDPQNYMLKIASVLLGTFILGLGVSLTVVPNLLFLPGEGVVSAVSVVTGWKFHHVKQGNDIILVTIAVIASFILFGELRGLREGTVISALLIGVVVGWVSPTVKKFVTAVTPGRAE